MTILVGIDGSSQWHAALSLAARFADGGRLVAATVRAPSARPAPARWEGSATVLRTVVEPAARAAGVADVDVRVLVDRSASRALHRLATEEAAELLVIGTGRRARLARALLGGTGERIVHGSPCPVAVAPRDHSSAPGPVRSIGVAYDGGAASGAALAWAQRLAERSGPGARLGLFTAVAAAPVAAYSGVAAPVDEYVTDRLRADARTRLDAALEDVPVALRPYGRVVDGPVVGALAEATAGLDLLVVGSRGHGPLGALLLGSVSRALVHEPPCPVVVVPPSAAAAADRLEAAGATTPVLREGDYLTDRRRLYRVLQVVPTGSGRQAAILEDCLTLDAALVRPAELGRMALEPVRAAADAPVTPGASEGAPALVRERTRCG